MLGLLGGGASVLAYPAAAQAGTTTVPIARSLRPGGEFDEFVSQRVRQPPACANRHDVVDDVLFAGALGGTGREPQICTLPQL